MLRSFVVVLFFFASSAFAAAAEDSKRDLVMKVLEILDSRKMTTLLIDTAFRESFSAGNQQMAEYVAQLSADERATFEEEQKRARDEAETMRERILQRIDHQKFALEVYYPIIDRTYSEAQLRELLAFYETKTGQKTIELIPELAVVSLVQGAKLLSDTGNQIAEEIAAEEEAKRPKWKRAMADLRTLATATEAYATDYEAYPAARDLSELRKSLEPVYVRTMPEKDPWGSSYSYVVSGDAMHYRFASAGADGVFEWDSKRIETGVEPQPQATDSEDSDLVYQDGQFIRFPREAAKEMGYRESE